MEMIPKLSELLKNKTTLLLGAGASFDYGFPLWNGLKSKMLEILENYSDYNLTNNDGVNWWVERLQSMTEEETIDKVATFAPEEHYDLFRQLVSIAIIEYENVDSERDTHGWIEKFSEKFAQVLVQQYPDSVRLQETIENFKVITLNYDRVFDIRFKHKIEQEFKKVLTKPREFEKFYKSIFLKFGSIYHPHGCLGPTEGISIDCYTYMNPNNAFGIPYGKIQNLKNSFKNGKIPFVFPVDDLKGVENVTYTRANKILNETENVVCIGLSPLGIRLSDLDLSNVKTVYYSGKEEVFDNFVSLGKYAEEITNEL